MGGGSAAAPSLPVVTATPAPTPSPTPAANALSIPSAPGAATISFSGYTWSVRNDTGGPGPNTFSSNNVWVDASGFLHLKISHATAWSTAEIVLNQNLGFGTYQWVLVGHPESMDNNVVLGLFTYTTPAIGPDGTNEIDIEFATWGGAQSLHGNWTAWPPALGPTQWTQPFDASALGGVSTQSFVWESQSITYNTQSGLPASSALGFHAQAGFAPTNPLQTIPQSAEPVHMNLWLFNGHPPTDGNEVEIVVSSFTFTPG